MSIEKAMERIHFVVYGENKDRVKVKKSRGGELTMSIDLHQLRRKEADKLLNNVINVIQEPFSLEVIHGYNHGTVLQQHVRNNLKNRKVRDIRLVSYNPGVTFLQIA